MKRGFERLHFLIGFLVMVGAGCFGLFLLIQQPADVEAGRNYIREQSNKSVGDLQETLEKRRNEETAGTNDASSVFESFSDYVILGDSRASGFSAYGFLPESRILAGTGDTPYSMEDHLDSIKALQPRIVILSYGQNDMRNNLLNVQGGYKELYKKQIDRILDIVPGSTVYINSIIPASAEVQKSDPVQERLDAYNEALRELCDEEGYIYIDNGSLARSGNADIYASDGIHFQPDFYSAWAENMIRVIEES